MKYMKILLAVFTIMTVACILYKTDSYAASQNQERTIKVVFPEQAGLSQIDEKGNYSGYTY